MISISSKESTIL